MMFVQVVTAYWSVLIYRAYVTEAIALSVTIRFLTQ